MRYAFSFCLLSTLGILLPSAHAAPIDFSAATVVVRGGDRPPAEKIASTILTEEIAKRAGVKWTVIDQWPTQAQTIIALSVKASPPAWKDHIPASASSSSILDKAEGFSIRIQEKTESQSPTIYVTGTDPRGLMFGVGKLLRSFDWNLGTVKLASEFQLDNSPDVPLRGEE